MNTRAGVVSVEMVFVIPVVLVLFFGLWEWSRVEMIKHVCQNACFEGARFGTLPGSTPTETESEVQKVLDIYFVKDATIDATFNAGTGESTVSVSIPMDSNFIGGYAFFQGRAIEADITLFQ